MKNKTFNIKVLDNIDSNAQTLSIEGDIGIKNAQAIKKAIQSIKLTGDFITIFLTNIEKIDITSIQTIRALRIALEMEGKETCVFSELTDEIEKLLKNTGFDKTI